MDYTYIIAKTMPSYDLEHTLAYHHHSTFGCHHTFSNINPFYPTSVCHHLTTIFIPYK